MAQSNESQDKTLSKMFDDGLETYNSLSKMDLPSNSLEFQV